MKYLLVILFLSCSLFAYDSSMVGNEAPDITSRFSLHPEPHNSLRAHLGNVVLVEIFSTH